MAPGTRGVTPSPAGTRPAELAQLRMNSNEDMIPVARAARMCAENTVGAPGNVTGLAEDRAARDVTVVVTVMKVSTAISVAMGTYVRRPRKVM